MSKVTAMDHRLCRAEVILYSWVGLLGWFPAMHRCKMGSPAAQILWEGLLVGQDWRLLTGL